MKKILIANRGEISIRIMRTCRELGIKTVAVHSEADEHSPHALFADERYCIGPASATESYLNIERLFEAVKKSGADGLHPGYGFLSENAILPQTCEEFGITFIGPSKESMKLMGSKIESKQKVIARGVPVVPGEVKAIPSLEEAKLTAKKNRIPCFSQSGPWRGW